MACTTRHAAPESCKSKITQINSAVRDVPTPRIYAGERCRTPRFLATEPRRSRKSHAAANPCSERCNLAAQQPRTPTHTARSVCISARQQILARQSAHARRRPALRENRPLYSVPRRRPAAVDERAPPLVDQRAIGRRPVDIRRCGSNNQTAPCYGAATERANLTRERSMLCSR